MAKFEYIDDIECKDLDLVIYKIMKPTDILIKGTIIEVPEELDNLIRRLRISGRYKELPKTKGKVKKVKRNSTKKESES